MEKTVVTIDLDKKSLHEALTRVIEYITLTPPGPDELGEGSTEFYLGIEALFDCLRQTY